ncbi:MAG: leucine-rich repeat domain-containing protein [Muribaculum sp.]|nr:leucine-rich repeat domain-containing protein [Muribaculum sp.]
MNKTTHRGLCRRSGVAKCLLVLMMISLSAITAKGFMYNGINYAVYDEAGKTCLVASGGYNSDQTGFVAGNDVYGDLIIPSEVQYNGTTYTVVGIGALSFYANDLNSVVLPPTITIIGTYAFMDCRDLVQINIPDGVTDIYDGAFANCSSLKSIDLPESVTTIMSETFYGCSGLTSISIPESVTAIKGQAFSGCSGLTSVFIPKQVVEIGNAAFSGCSALQEINVDAENQTFASDGGVLFDKSKTSLLGYPAGGKSDYAIPEFVTEIGQRAFEGCEKLSSVSLHHGLTVLRAGCFRNCKSLKSITIPGSIDPIDQADPYTLGYYIFENCTALESVVIEEPIWRLSYCMFKGCTSLTNVSLPKTLLNISESFSGCTGLKSIKVPDSVTHIDFGFENCTSLETVVLGESVSDLGWAFTGCSSLATLYSKNPTPPTCTNAFETAHYNTTTIYVPTGCRAAYKAKAPWSRFKYIYEFDFAGIEDVEADEVGSDAPVEVYNLSGVKIADTEESLVPGLYVVRRGDAVSKIVVK